MQMQYANVSGHVNVEASVVWEFKIDFYDKPLAIFLPAESLYGLGLNIDAGESLFIFMNKFFYNWRKPLGERK